MRKFFDSILNLCLQIVICKWRSNEDNATRPFFDDPEVPSKIPGNDKDPNLKFQSLQDE